MLCQITLGSSTATEMCLSWLGFTLKDRAKNYLQTEPKMQGEKRQRDEVQYKYVQYI